MKKCEFNPLHRFESTLGCYEGKEKEPTELVNGWVWNNKYYATLESLNNEYFQKIHIGKSSAGWRFGLCIYPKENPKHKGESWNDKYLDKPIESLHDWIELFNNPNNYIEDEYGNKITKEEMIDIIAHRKPHSGEELREGWHKLYIGTQFESKKEYFFIKGLIVHKYTRPYPHELNLEKYNKNITIMPEDCTYDLIFSGNDVEFCEIFS